MYLIFLFLISLTSISSSSDSVCNSYLNNPKGDNLPHCATLKDIIHPTSSGDISGESSDEIKNQFSAKVGSTVCVLLKGLDDDITLHTIKISHIEQHFRIPHTYEFAIPEVKTDCKCYCSKDTAPESCSAKTHLSKNCNTDDNGSSCYRTFFPNPMSKGCADHDQPKVCCEVDIKPKDKIYAAVKLEQPRTFARTEYKVYDYANGTWKEVKNVTNNIERIGLSTGTFDRTIDKSEVIGLEVSSLEQLISNPLLPGMYFSERESRGFGELRDGKDMLNDFNEHDFYKLGWYRRQGDREKFDIHNGTALIQNIHMAKSTHCGDGEQTFDTSLRAKFYAEHDKTFEYKIPPPLILKELKIKSARINANRDDDRRSAIVSYSEKRNLRFTLRTTKKSNGEELVLCHHPSRISNFSGTIVLDTNSNWYLNLTLYNASGYINGFMKNSSEQSDDLYSFTEYAGSQDKISLSESLHVTLPSDIEKGERMICLNADKTPGKKPICHTLKFIKSEQNNTSTHLIESKLKSNCNDCNPITTSTTTPPVKTNVFTNLLSSILPEGLINELKDFGEVVFKVVSVIVIVILGIIAIIVIILIVRFVIYPLCKLIKWLKVFSCICPDYHGLNSLNRKMERENYKNMIKERERERKYIDRKIKEEIEASSLDNRV